MSASDRRTHERLDLDAVIDRTMPHNLDAERSVLGAILLHNDAYEVAAKILTPGDFFRDAHRRVFLAMARLLDVANGAVDLLTLTEELERRGDLTEVGRPYLNALIDGVPRSTNVDHYAGIVKEKSLHRALIAVANKILTAAYDAEDAPHEIITRADHALIELAEEETAGLQSLRASTSGVLERLEFRHANRGQVTGLPTGFKSIDDQTLGWQPGDLIVIGARPSIGKTTFALQSALYTAMQTRPDGQLYSVAVFSLEMKLAQLEDRYIASLAKIPLTRILSGFIFEHEWAPLSHAIGTLAESGLYIDDTANRTVIDIRRECRRLKAERGLDLVVVDYFQLTSPSTQRRGGTRTEEFTDSSLRLKHLARELNVPVLLLSQLKRGSDDRADPKPKLSDLRETGALEQDADIVCFLHRRLHREGGCTNFILEKQRMGPTGSVNLTLERDIVTFHDGGEEVAATPVQKAEDAQAAKVRAIRSRHRART